MSKNRYLNKKVTKILQEKIIRISDALDIDSSAEFLYIKIYDFHVDVLTLSENKVYMRYHLNNAGVEAFEPLDKEAIEICSNALISLLVCLEILCGGVEVVEWHVGASEEKAYMVNLNNVKALCL